MTPTYDSVSVLLNVDDHEPARYARSRILRQAGFKVHDAASGAEALEMVNDLHPDLILLDVNLPDFSGIEVCRRIKALEDTVSVIVLQISASATSAPHATAALNTGADSYLAEPVDPDVLIATVRALLRARAAERELGMAYRELSDKNTELHKLNQSLQRSNEDLEHFAYIASHDLQEPLRTISTHVQLLEGLARPRFNEAERDIFNVVKDAALRMSVLIRDVLAYSRTAEERPPLAPMSLHTALETALHDLNEAIVTAEATVTLGSLPMVEGDISQLSRVFQNLLGNALKYRAGDRPLRILIESAHSADGGYVVRIADNGIGISPEYMEKIFVPFKRLHGREIPGSGIGLALCRRIIEGHGGRIWAETNQDGPGTTFCFTLHAAGAA